VAAKLICGQASRGESEAAIEETGFEAETHSVLERKPTRLSSGVRPSP
jgi:hypothetical protein